MSQEQSWSARVERWRKDVHDPFVQRRGQQREQFTTAGGIPLAPAYTPADREGIDAALQEGLPGEYPYTRGVYPTMYRGRHWTMRQYAGFGSARESNQRYHYLLSQGQTGLSVAFDLPTQIGYDSDHFMAQGEVGRVGVAIDSLADMEILLDGLPLDKVSTSMTINAPAAVLLAMYIAVAEKQGISPSALRGTIQNDILKEYIARGTYIFPPSPSMRLVVDTFAFCRDHLPNWNTISISGYHMREAGATAVQEIAFTLANAIAYVEAGLEAGLTVDEFAPRLSFFFNADMDFFEEIAKFRAARRLWAKIMTDRFGAADDRSKTLRFHTQTSGAALTAQQPDNNVVRVALQALSAVLGGTQSLHTNALDEALALPSEHSARIALRTQQILAYETGVANTVDPLGGSYFVETLTDAVEKEVEDYLERIDAFGGAVAAIERGFMQREIQESAYRFQRLVETKERIIVGVNAFTSEEDPPEDLLTLDPAVVRQQLADLQKVKDERDNSAVEAALANLKGAAQGTDNLLPYIVEAVKVYATLGEISDTLRSVFGEFRPGDAL